jgi:uncharacterized protein involved in cysteine biosynthesis
MRRLRLGQYAIRSRGLDVGPLTTHQVWLLTQNQRNLRGSQAKTSCLRTFFSGGFTVLESILVLLLGIVVILAIIAANGYFVAQEFADMAVDRTRLAARAAEADAAVQRALAVTKRTSFMLSGAQLGITAGRVCR